MTEYVVNCNIENSPTWKKPNEVMTKLYSRKKRKTNVKDLSRSEGLDDTALQSNKKQRKNPFAKRSSSMGSLQSAKKDILSFDNDISVVGENQLNITDDCSTRLYSDLNSAFALEEKSNVSNNDIGYVDINEDSLSGLFLSNNISAENEEKIEVTSCKLPADWSLKAKARFMSSSSFAWCSRIKWNEEAISLSKATHYSCNEQNSGTGKKSESDFRIELGRCLVYWQHPDIPWLPLFPRYEDEIKSAFSTDEPLVKENARSSLYDRWVSAFRSAYQQLRQNLCPYFYVCSQQYTALFVSAFVNCRKQINCVLTPTSLGLRNSLKSEGLAFSMPLQNHRDPLATICNGKLISINEDSPETKEPSQSESLEDDMSWQSISDRLQFRKSKELTTAVANDGLPSTTLLIEGVANTQLLFNYLLNCRVSIATSGRQAGIPPTIISPVAFHGATLKKLEYRIGAVKVDERYSTSLGRSAKITQAKHQYSLDITGPLMPHHVHDILLLLNSIQDDGMYTAAFKTYTHTAALNVYDHKHETSGDFSCTSEVGIPTNVCGLTPDCAERLKSSSKSLCLKKIVAKNCLYEYSV